MGHATIFGRENGEKLYIFTRADMANSKRKLSQPFRLLKITKSDEHKTSKNYEKFPKINTCLQFSNFVVYYDNLVKQPE